MQKLNWFKSLCICYMIWWWSGTLGWTRWLTCDCWQCCQTSLWCPFSHPDWQVTCREAHSGLESTPGEMKCHGCWCELPVLIFGACHSCGMDATLVAWLSLMWHWVWSLLWHGCLDGYSVIYKYTYIYIYTYMYMYIYIYEHIYIYIECLSQLFAVISHEFILELPHIITTFTRAFMELLPILSSCVGVSFKPPEYSTSFHLPHHGVQANPHTPTHKPLNTYRFATHCVAIGNWVCDICGWPVHTITHNHLDNILAIPSAELLFWEPLQKHNYFLVNVYGNCQTNTSSKVFWCLNSSQLCCACETSS